MKRTLSYVASLHRFRDKAALHIRGASSTLYLTATEARQLSAALNECAENIGDVKFSDSSFGTHDILPSAAFYESDATGMTRQSELDESNKRILES